MKKQITIPESALYALRIYPRGYIDGVRLTRADATDGRTFECTYVPWTMLSPSVAVGTSYTMQATMEIPGVAGPIHIDHVRVNVAVTVASAREGLFGKTFHLVVTPPIVITSDMAEDVRTARDDAARVADFLSPLTF